MAPPSLVAPVKLLVALLWSDVEGRDDALRRLETIWGRIDLSGDDHPFDSTNYYESEMGSALMRRIVSFERLVPPESLADAKWQCNELEDGLSTSGKRRVNLDVGYLDLSKVVLASVKFAGQKIAIGRGIYADLVGRYRAGRYQPFEWTFPDFRDGRYDRDLERIRQRYREQLRNGAIACGDGRDQE